MGKTLMLYTSLTGNTKLMAETMINQLEQYDNEVVTKEFDKDSIDVKELLAYDVILIGVYTWSSGDVPIDVEDFYDSLYDYLDFKGKVCGVFGSADSSYDQYGTAVDMIYEQFEKLGAMMVPDRIIVDLEPNSKELERCKEMVVTAYEMIGRKSAI